MTSGAPEGTVSYINTYVNYYITIMDFMVASKFGRLVKYTSLHNNTISSC